MKYKKATLAMIILLLIIVLPMTIFGSVVHYKETHKPEENPKHDLFYNGKLYFYHHNKLLGTYNCLYPDGFCDYTFSRVDQDNKYDLDEYKPAIDVKIPLINNHYAFISDTTLTDITSTKSYLVDVTTGDVLNEYEEVKNYGVGIANNYFLVRDSNDKWGVISLGETIEEVLPFSYDYLALPNKRNSSGEIKSNTFITLKNNDWQLINDNKSEKSNIFKEKIVSFDEEYLITENNGFMKLVTYENIPVLTGIYKEIGFYEDNYLLIIDETNTFYIYNISSYEKIGDPRYAESLDEIELVKAEEGVNVLINGSLSQTVELN